MLLFALYSNDNGEPKQAIINVIGEDYIIGEGETPDAIIELLPDFNSGGVLFLIDVQDDDVQRILVADANGDEVGATFHTLDNEG